MSQELHALLRERSRMSVMGWPGALALSLLFHGMLVGAFYLAPKEKPAPEETRVTWVTLPALRSDNPGGSTPQEEGKTGERLRRVEEVAPVREEPQGSTPTPNAFGTKATNPLKGTNKNQESLGKAPVASKGATSTPGPVTGAAGTGSGGQLGKGTGGIPGLKSTRGVQGGTGLIDEVEGGAPAPWYAERVQQMITSNWSRLNGDTGRVQIYFRIRRNGTIEGERVEIPSISPILDKGALMAVKRSNPLPQLPPDREGLYMGVRMWFSYTGD